MLVIGHARYEAQALQPLAACGLGGAGYGLPRNAKLAWAAAGSPSVLAGGRRLGRVTAQSTLSPPRALLHCFSPSRVPCGQPLLLPGFFLGKWKFCNAGLLDWPDSVCA